MKANLLRGVVSAGVALTMAAGFSPVVFASNNATNDRAHCAGISEDASFLTSDKHRIARVQPLRRSHRIGKAVVQRTVGTRLTVLAHEGLNRQYLQRMVNCQLPREISAVATDTNVPNVKAQVHEWVGGLLVDIEAENASEGRDVESLVRRALDQRVQVAD